MIFRKKILAILIYFHAFALKTKKLMKILYFENNFYKNLKFKIFKKLNILLLNQILVIF